MQALMLYLVGTQPHPPPASPLLPAPPLVLDDVLAAAGLLTLEKGSMFLLQPFTGWLVWL